MAAPLLAGLEDEPIRYAGHIGFFSTHEVEDVVTAGESVALIGRSDERWAYLVSDNLDECRRLLARLVEREGITAYALLEAEMAALLPPLAPRREELRCLRYYYPQEAPLPPEPETVEIVPLTEDDSALICRESTYRDKIGEGYIEEAIREGVSAGVRDKNRLVAWATTHDDLAIGNLHVLPEYRRRGYGKAIVIALMGALREAGFTPIMNIEAENRASRNLAESLGFQKDREVIWSKLKG